MSSLATLCLISATALICSSCDQRNRIEKSNSRQILIVSNSAEPAGLDPQTVSGVPENNIMRALFEGLCLEHPEHDGQSLPGAAASWSSNADATVWTFQLQPDGHWSDGVPLTTDDFLFAYHRSLHPEFAGKSASMLYFIQGAEAFNKGEEKRFSQVGVKALDSHTLEITTHSPTPFLPELTKHFAWFPVPKHVILAHGDMTTPYSRWTDPGNLVSNGPFQLSEWKFNYYIEVRKNPHYWDRQQVSLKGIRFLPITNTYTEARMFYDQQLHATYGLAPEMIDYSAQHHPKALHQEPYLGTAFIRCNMDTPALADLRVRRALACAIDQQAIIDNIAKGKQQPAHGFTPDFGSYQSPKVIRFDPQKARQLLADAGFPNGKGFPKLNLLTADRDLAKRLSEAYQDMWKKHLGIQVGIQQQEWKTYLVSRRKRNYDLCVSSWVGDYPDPSTFLNIWTQASSDNHTGWHHPEFESLLARAARDTNTENRNRTLAQAETILLEQAPILPVYHLTTNYLLHPSVQGWHPLILNNHPYKFLKLTNH
ncbi:peptide ABC transporter substrate-binding protein [Verrucomicrobiaceae bacterium N1E253]|uniref:Peptide ABC transporter substrate-binding protein n=2 Tax=Oceaniferula marina TaxID=2748318 RepID=A0A851GK93_9BACT|nr:peptide ABC transporter substrate-binding protein [Oceaniferula marina]